MSAGGKTGIKLSVPLLLLDLAGSLLLALGLVELFSPVGELVPAAFRFPYYAPVMIVLGGLLTLPFLLDLLKQARSGKPEQEGPSQPSYRRRR